MPFVEDGDGNCHVYVDAAADLSMAEDIVVNAKMQRPGVCNAAETLLVHRKVAAGLPAPGGRGAGRRRPRRRRGRPGRRRRHRSGQRRRTSPSSSWGHAWPWPWSTPSTTPSTTSPRYCSGHSEAIVTGDLAAADRFTAEVDAAAVLVNASTRFVDGEQFGLGAEIGISTQKLHARGPMGVRELTCVKYVVHGNGQVRP